MKRHRYSNTLSKLLRLKSLLVLASDVLIPICPTILLTIHLLSSSTSNTYSNPTTAPLIIDYSKRMTWRDYLMENSVEQFINGNETELRESMKTLTEMELYFERWVSNHKDTRLIQQCVNKHRLCVYWASIQECTANPVFMEPTCMLACQQCHLFIDWWCVLGKKTKVWYCLLACQCCWLKNMYI